MFLLRTANRDSIQQGKAIILMHMKEDFSGDQMTLQRPSACVKSYSLRESALEPNAWARVYGDETVRGPRFVATLDFELDTDVISKIQDSWGDNRSNFTKHRSRIAAIAVRRLQYTENAVRLSRVAQRGHFSFDKRLVRVAQEAWLSFEERMLKSLSIGSHTQTYIDDHPSSVAPGVKWQDMTDVQIKQLLEACQMHLEERVREGIGTDKLIHPYDIHFGQRARSTPLPTADVRESYVVEMGRTRIVMYNGAMSGVNAFVPHDLEIEAYRKAMQTVGDAAGLEVHSPVVEGGEFYVKVSELMNDYQYAATDGANWEINVPYIMPDLLAYTSVGEVVLPSGSHDTSLLGSLASLVLAGSINVAEIISVQGDDLGLFYNGRLRYKDIPGISELDVDDTRFKYILGYSYENPEFPHSCGIKLTTDSAENMIPRKVGSVGPPISRKLNYREIERYICIYTGILENGESLLTELRHLPAGVEFYPRKTKEMLMDESDRSEVD